MFIIVDLKTIFSFGLGEYLLINIVFVVYAEEFLSWAVASCWYRELTFQFVYFRFIIRLFFLVLLNKKSLILSFCGLLKLFVILEVFLLLSSLDRSFIFFVECAMTAKLFKTKRLILINWHPNILIFWLLDIIKSRNEFNHTAFRHSKLLIVNLLHNLMRVKIIKKIWE